MRFPLVGALLSVCVYCRGHRPLLKHNNIERFLRDLLDRLHIGQILSSPSKVFANLELGRDGRLCENANGGKIKDLS